MGGGRVPSSFLWPRRAWKPRRRSVSSAGKRMGGGPGGPEEIGDGTLRLRVLGQRWIPRGSLGGDVDRSERSASHAEILALGGPGAGGSGSRALSDHRLSRPARRSLGHRLPLYPV